jgi:hypothetical protein
MERVSMMAGGIKELYHFRKNPCPSRRRSGKGKDARGGEEKERPLGPIERQAST